jgi:hypothetical protein
MSKPEARSPWVEAAPAVFFPPLLVPPIYGEKL